MTKQSDRATQQLGDAKTLDDNGRRYPAAARYWFGVLRKEASLTARVMADNLSASCIPAVLFSMAACAYRDVSGFTLLLRLCETVALFCCYCYVFDASNQATSTEEDRLNKPWRPIPAGLTTPRGLLRRFWLAMAVYTLVGWATGTLVWVLAWQAVVIGECLISRPRDYLWVKPIGMLSGTVLQLAAAWQLVTPIDATGWRWIIVLAIAFNLPLRFEDIRDVEGDKKLGRITLPMLIGEWPIRIWFALTVAAVPFALHVLLYTHSSAGRWQIWICDAVMASICWAAAIRSLTIQGYRADRITYLLYTFAYCASTASGAVIL
jgi:4-hydroxybenzoate polyprenyltransferase